MATHSNWRNSLHKALGEAIQARLVERLSIRKGQRHIAQEFGLTQADVSICASGNWGRMTVDKLMDVAAALGLGFGAEVTVTGCDREFSVSVARIKAAVISDEEQKETEREERRKERGKNPGRQAVEELTDEQLMARSRGEW